MNSTNEYRNMKNHFCLNLFFLLYLFFCAGCKQHISDSAAKANEALFTQLAYIIHSGFISGYQNRYGDNLKPPTNVYHRMTA